MPISIQVLCEMESSIYLIILILNYFLLGHLFPKLNYFCALASSLYFLLKTIICTNYTHFDKEISIYHIVVQCRQYGAPCHIAPL
jgi:hypothetical protein